MDEIRSQVTGPLQEIAQQVRDNWDRIWMLEVATAVMCFALGLILIIVAKQDLAKPSQRIGHPEVMWKKKRELHETN